MEIGNIAQWASVITSAFIAVLAIWGDRIRYRLSGPRLSVSLLSADGEVTTLTGGNLSRPVPVRYYHLRVTNNHRSAPARRVRVVIAGLARTASDQSWAVLPLSGPLQLHWQFPGSSPQFPDVGPDHTCDLGSVVSPTGFTPALYITPNNFQGTVGARERIRLEIRALADNAESEPLFLDISWDGLWSEDTVTMRRHLVVRSVNSMTAG